MVIFYFTKFVFCTNILQKNHLMNLISPSKQNTEAFSQKLFLEVQLTQDTLISEL